ncbi:hypothetical protein QTO34_006097 [Cnephaeus nilssonii]|uniref:Uncharacterized protein n=1 Tax=Cnephaeus nilssonii TaxID=3371016 RepID=A0AA40HN56_CNENI|nr:hypothetical protein QTO34_006097 [Eptesicus nilssonii]
MEASLAAGKPQALQTEPGQQDMGASLVSVINAALALAARPKSQVVKKTMEMYKCTWENHIHVLTEAVDDITSIDDFLAVSATTKSPLTTESAVEKTEDNNTRVLTVDISANKHQIKQAVKKLYDIVVAKVNTLIRPDGEKKAYVPLAPYYPALDVSSKIESCWVPKPPAPEPVLGKVQLGFQESPKQAGVQSFRSMLQPGAVRHPSQLKSISPCVESHIAISHVGAGVHSPCHRRARNPVRQRDKKRLPPALSATRRGTPIWRRSDRAGGQRKTAAGGKLVPAATQSATPRSATSVFRSAGLSSAGRPFKPAGGAGESHILEDVNKCIIALRDQDADNLDRAAGAIRGRAARVAHIVTGEMDSYEPGAYTEAPPGRQARHGLACPQAGPGALCACFQSPPVPSAPQPPRASPRHKKASDGGCPATQFCPMLRYINYQLSPVCQQPRTCLRSSHTLMVPTPLASADSAEQLGLVAAAALITPQEQGEVEKS